ncbi:hypothetical protein CBS12448_3611 [Aspergillus niger]|nr:hypothetical protein CBS11350_5763 [Aspergillus niger]KAI2863576.1 hypothetical protein CBS12448_3611 [Aspergillus niger]KAI2897799.1 hypothetical protein CBS11852_3810 [Aspergillus niger]
MMDTVKWLLDVNPSTIQARDREGATVFHYAARYRASGIVVIWELVKMLLNVAGRQVATLLSPMKQDDDRAGAKAPSVEAIVKPPSVLVYALDPYYRRRLSCNMHPKLIE